LTVPSLLTYRLVRSPVWTLAELDDRDLLAGGVLEHRSGHRHVARSTLGSDDCCACAKGAGDDGDREGEANARVPEHFD